MARRRWAVEEIIIKLREAEIGLAQGGTVAQVCRRLGDHQADLLPMAPGVWWAADGLTESRLDT